MARRPRLAPQLKPTMSKPVAPECTTCSTTCYASNVGGRPHLVNVPRKTMAFRDDHLTSKPELAQAPRIVVTSTFFPHPNSTTRNHATLCGFTRMRLSEVHTNQRSNSDAMQEVLFSDEGYFIPSCVPTLLMKLVEWRDQALARASRVNIKHRAQGWQ